MATRVRRDGRILWALGLIIALALAGIVSFYASSQPDGLEKVAAEKGFLETAQDHSFAGSPLADYGVAGVADDRLSVGLAGLLGVTATLAVGGGLFWLARRRHGEASADSAVT